VSTDDQVLDAAAIQDLDDAGEIKLGLDSMTARGTCQSMQDQTLT